MSIFNYIFTQYDTIIFVLDDYFLLSYTGFYLSIQKFNCLNKIKANELFKGF